MSTERIDARDVLDTNAKTARGFRARIVGHFRRAGPNPWDDYTFQPIAAGDVVDVLADVPIQVETDGAVFRMRLHGEVDRLVWEPPQAPGGEPELRARFLAEYVRPFSEDAGIGAAAVIARKLNSTSPKPSLD